MSSSSRSFHIARNTQSVLRVLSVCSDIRSSSCANGPPWSALFFRRQFPVDSSLLGADDFRHATFEICDARDVSREHGAPNRSHRHRILLHDSWVARGARSRSFCRISGSAFARVAHFAKNLLVKPACRERPKWLPMVSAWGSRLALEATTSDGRRCGNVEMPRPGPCICSPTSSWRSCKAPARTGADSAGNLSAVDGNSVPRLRARKCATN